MFSTYQHYPMHCNQWAVFDNVWVVPFVKEQWFYALVLCFCSKPKHQFRVVLPSLCAPGRPKAEALLTQLISTATKLTLKKRSWKTTCSHTLVTNHKKFNASIACLFSVDYILKILRKGSFNYTRPGDQKSIHL